MVVMDGALIEEVAQSRFRVLALTDGSEAERIHHRDGTRVHYLRSAADPLIRSAAQALGGNVISVILTGGGQNGSGSVRDVKALGGTVIAQDPATALHGAMPRAAIATGAVDYVLPLEAIGPMLVRLTSSAPNEEDSSKEAV